MARTQKVAEAATPKPRRGAPEGDAGLARRTVTGARRRRPSSKAREVETVSELRQRATSTRAKAKTGRGSKKGLAAKPSARGREDKRESPAEMETTATPKNVKADKNDKKSKGKSTYELESSNPSKRPSRKSTRGGANHIKPDSQQRRQHTRAVRSPKTRNAMRGG
jgi:hypothetical protein